jgi:prophage regulatory protein
MRLIKLKEVMHITSLARSTIYKYVKDGEFPKSVSLGEKAVAWIESEVQEWVSSRVRNRVLLASSLNAHSFETSVLVLDKNLFTLMGGCSNPIMFKLLTLRRIASYQVIFPY